MSPKIRNKHWLLIAIMAAATALLGLFAVVLSSHAQIEPKRPQVMGGSGLGFAGANSSDDLIVFDMGTGTSFSTTISLLPESEDPFDATMIQDGSQVWISGFIGDGLIVVDTNTPGIVHRISGLGDKPIDIVFSEDSQFAYVSMRNTAEDIKIVDTTTFMPVGDIPVPDYFLGSGKMRLNHCTGELYAVNYFDFHFFVINPISQTVTSEMTFGDSLWDLTIDPLATTLYIADRGTPDAVHVFDIATLTTTTSIPVGNDPWGIDITPDGRYVLTANQLSHDVSIIDTATNSVITTTFLAADADPRDIDINAEGTYAYVPSGSVAGEDGVYVIDLATFQVVDFILSPVGGGTNPVVVAVAPDFASLDPVASFTATTPVEIGTPVQFFDTTTNNPTSWQWDFGDGLGNSSEQNPIYNYANPGTYTVTLTVANACGSTMFQDSVTVTTNYKLYLPFIGKDSS